MKAYRHEDGSVWTFRPEANAARFNRSRAPPGAAGAAGARLHRVAQGAGLDRRRLGSRAGARGRRASTCARSCMRPRCSWACVRPPRSPTASSPRRPAAYFPGGVKPVSLWISTDFARAGAGGTGAAKCGGNYALSLAGQMEGAEHGCDQAVFLDSSTHTYIEELGGMNLFLVYRDGRIVTPELTGSILEGVTRSLDPRAGQGDGPASRRSARSRSRNGRTRRRSGELAEVFACGTAAVITPVGELKWDGGSVDHRRDGHEDTSPSASGSGSSTSSTGATPDTRGWLHPARLSGSRRSRRMRSSCAVPGSSPPTSTGRCCGRTGPARTGPPRPCRAVQADGIRTVLVTAPPAALARRPGPPRRRRRGRDLRERGVRLRRAAPKSLVTQGHRARVGRRRSSRTCGVSCRESRSRPSARPGLALEDAYRSQHPVPDGAVHGPIAQP